MRRVRADEPRFDARGRTTAGPATAIRGCAMRLRLAIAIAAAPCGCAWPLRSRLRSAAALGHCDSRLRYAAALRCCDPRLRCVLRSAAEIRGCAVRLRAWSLRFAVALRAEMRGCALPASIRLPGRVRGSMHRTLPAARQSLSSLSHLPLPPRHPIRYATAPGAEGSVRHGAGRAGQCHGDLLADGPPSGRGRAGAAARLPGRSGRGAQRGVLPVSLQHGGCRLPLVAAADHAGRRTGRAAARSAGLDPRAVRGR